MSSTSATVSGDGFSPNVVDLRRDVRVVQPQGDGLLDSLYEIWTFRELLYFLVWRNIKIRYKQTVIGVAWALVQPAALGVVFSYFFGRYANLPSDGLPHPVFFMCTVLPWTYIAATLLATTSSLVDHQHLITKVYFPRILLPLSVVFVGLVDFAVALIGLVIVFVVYGIPVSSDAWMAPVAMGMALIATFGAGLWLAAANTYYRDVRYAVPFLIQLLMFASPVVYPASVVPSTWRTIYGLNPVSGVLETFRWALTGAGERPGWHLVGSAAVSVLFLVSGLMFFRSVEASLTDVV